MVQSILTALINSVLSRPDFYSILAAALVWLLRTFLKDKFDKNQTIFEQGVKVAYNIVQELAAKTDNKVDDKVAEGLKALSEYLATHGQKLTPVQADRAKLIFTAISGAEKGK